MAVSAGAIACSQKQSERFWRLDARRADAVQRVSSIATLTRLYAFSPTAGTLPGSISTTTASTISSAGYR
jgi:hypothetical protein